MNKIAKTEWLNRETLAYYSGFGGIEIKRIFYNVNGDNVVVYVAGAWCSNKSVHCVKLYYTKIGAAYFKHNGTRVKISECIKA